MSSKKYWNKNLSQMEPYVPGAQPPVTGNTIKLNTNENPYPPSPKVLEAIHSIPALNYRLYPKAEWDELRKSIACQYKVAENNIFCSNGSDEILSLLFRCFADPGDRALFTYPTYSLYEVLAEANGVNYSYIQTRDDFSIDFAALPSDGYALAFIANPNAPTGRLEPLAEIAAFAKRFKGVVVVDEAYIDFCDNPTQNSALQLIASLDNLLVSRTFSKSFSLCGLRIGYCFANEALIQALMAAKDSYNLDMVAQTAGKAAIDDIKWMQNNAARIIATRQHSAEMLNKLGFHILPSQGNFLFVSHPSVPAEKIYQALAAREIYVRYFKKERLHNFLRISIGSDAEMERLLSELDTIMSNLCAKLH